MMQTNLTLKSRNVKTGPIPVSTTSEKSCPTACPFKNKNGCYAELGHVGMFWNKVTAGKTGTDFDQFCKQIDALEPDTLWRHNQAGDLIGDRETIDAQALRQLTRANGGKRGFTYTHYDVLNNRDNFTAVQDANRRGFTVNLSANNLAHADKLAETGIAPVVVVLPSDATENTVTPMGRKVIVCPATVRDDISCKTCALCQKQRAAIVGFPAHGVSKKRVDAIFEKESI